MRRSVKSLMVLAMAASVSASMAVLSDHGVASGSKARDNVGTANAQTDTAAVNQTGGGAEAGIDTNTDTSTDIGAGFGTGGNSLPRGKIVIKHQYCNAETQGGLVVDELVKQFDEDNDHIQVVVEYNPGMYKGLMWDLQAKAAADNSSTLVQVDWISLNYFSSNFSHISSQGAIDRLNKEDAGFLQDKFLLSVLEPAVNSWGSQVGIPYSLSGSVFYINKDILRKAGLTEDGPTTWQEANKFARTVREKTGGYGFYMQEPADLWAQQGLIESSGVKMLTANAKGKKEVSFAAEDGAEVMRLIADTVRDRTALCISWEGGCQSFIDGNCVMLYTTIARRVSVQKGAQFDVATVRSPLWKDKKRMIPAGGCFLAIVAQGDDQIGTAWEFGKFLYSVEPMVAQTEGTGYVPPRKDMVGAENGLKTFLAENRVMNAAIQQMDGVVPWTTFPGDTGLQAEQMSLDVRDQTLDGQVTAEQDMKAVQDAINQPLAVQ